MMNFKTIMDDCKAEYQPFRGAVARDRAPEGFEEAITKTIDRNPIIAEIKPSSPSGMNKVVSDPKVIAREMMKGGACGLSVLTEKKHFGGSLRNLREVADVAQVPVLRKDFIFDEAQIPEAYYYGADSLLLIASFFSIDKLRKFLSLSRSLGMEPFVEVHSVKDLEKAKASGARIFVINNRDKDTLEIDLQRTEEFSPHIDGLKISASGISTLDDLRYVLDFCDAALMGNTIMRADDIEQKTREFVYGTR